MECRETESLLADYSVGLLKPRRRQAVEAHLDECPRCAREWQIQQSVMRLVREHGGLEPPPGLWNGIYNRIVAEPPVAPSVWSRFRFRPIRVIGSALAAAALAGAVWMSGQMGQFPTVAPERADRELAVAVREHVWASSDALFADRAGLESLAVLASYEVAADTN